jgi:hypothetical protein
MTDAYERASRDVADWFESLSLDAPALFPVSWAGEQASAGWFDIGREFTELWHHQQQIRMAVGADMRSDPRYLGAVIDVAVRGLPHAFRDVAAAPGETVAIDISGPAGGRWTLVRGAERWTLSRGEPSVATARIRLTSTRHGSCCSTRCQRTMPHEPSASRTAAARHSYAARSVGGRVDETIRTDQVGDLRSDTISSTSTRDNA